MQRFFNRFFIGIVLSLVLGITAFAQKPFTAALNVSVDKPGIKVSPSLYGIFFEEINLAGDGGIYPELIRNRSFEFETDKPEYWSYGASKGALVSVKLDDNDSVSEFNRKVLRVDYSNNSGTNVSVINSGYWGIPVGEGKSYDLVVYAKGSGGLNCRIETYDGKHIHGSVTIDKLDSVWKPYKLQITSNSNDPKSRFVISPTNKQGTFVLDYVSLKPAAADTFKGHGLRKDLMERLAALKPAFVRFPGGCWVEGDTMREASRWKRTIGKPIDRWTQPNLWNYKSTNGLGYHEYLQMCEDLDAAAMFVINCGMSHKEVVPMDKMGEFYQDALDAIEYANGSADTKWGKVRAASGHPAPFNLKYLEIGNENGGPKYWERYDEFFTKIREKYPEMRIIACEWNGGKTNKKPIEIIDEHYYFDPQFFISNADKYDSYDRAGKKIYVGEYAVTKKCGKGNLDGAIGEAAFMTGMERNSDIVLLSSYAPLFLHIDKPGWNWNPDMIGFDGTRSYGIPSYYVQQLFSVNRSDVIVPTTISVDTEPAIANSGSVGVGTWATQAEFKDAKVVKDDKTLFETTLEKAPSDAVKGTGDWQFMNGVLRQTSDKDDCAYTFGDGGWHDYVFTVKAKKTGGKEGFMVYFYVKESGQWARVNLGGWQNKWSAMQFDGENLPESRSDFVVETNRWYDIRIEVKDNNAKCFVDGKLILESKLPQRKMNTMFAVSGLNEKQDELIMKVVNTASIPCETKFIISGATKLGTTVKETVLTSENGTDENTIDYPEKVSPKEDKFTVNSPTFKKTLPAKSVTILRVSVK
ncbi:MAG: hypothetical protein LBU65_01810 [Planctomycetaceae bacterium]|jgi:alpha-L-arabinofuranosidase|nr:hypothetical protein [Planctomycetaceae bacterium]